MTRALDLTARICEGAALYARQDANRQAFYAMDSDAYANDYILIGLEDAMIESSEAWHKWRKENNDIAHYVMLIANEAFNLVLALDKAEKGRVEW